MINEQLYNRTVGILEQAYLNNTLQHGICTACAVGNIIAGNMGIKVIYREPHVTHSLSGEKFVMHRAYWVLPNGEIVDSMGPRWWRHKSDIYGDANFFLTDEWREGYEQILATGYSMSEVFMIEAAFENADKGNSEEDWMFNGLMDVINILDQIHENTDNEITVKSKGRFNKQLA